MIFPVAECERTVRAGDKTRLSGVKSFIGKGESPISKVEICPDYFPAESTPEPVSLDGLGLFALGNFDITNVTSIDLNLVKPGMSITAPAYDLGVTAVVQSVDVVNQTITTDSPAADNQTTQFHVSGESQVSVDPVFIDVSGREERDWFLDWVYTGDTRNVAMAVRVTTAGIVSETGLKSIEVLSPADDVLFSSDDDLTALEPTLSRFVPEGRASFINVHREAKLKILESLSDNAVRNADGSALTSATLKNVDEVRTWSRDLTLSLIFQGMSNESGDVFQAKAKYYSDLALSRAEKAFVTLQAPAGGFSGPHDQPFRAQTMATVSLIR